MAPSSRMIEGPSRARWRSFMAQPFKNPTSGVYYIRRRVPEELRPVLGREFKRSLQTRDPSEAKARFAAEWSKSEEAFSLARAQLSGVAMLTARDIQQLASRWFKCELAQLERKGDFRSYLIQGPTVRNEGPGGYQEHEYWLPRRRQQLSATPDLSGTVLPLCLIPNSALKSAPPFKSVVPKASACAGLPA
ncbi:DUF6538 domain-containing protein [Stutzerimonas frequens]|uniref:DUF6538 domain-containing protein n=1 Tax=Stutzerimonas frequens TaxID=2968969 RepID=UPI002D8046F1|nr:DUF6538 domain-containing protein [Stutzerimonas frequens]